jgi:tetratricopeptide (TPR) repeat protein
VLGAGLLTLAGIAALMPLAWHVLATVDRSVHLPGGDVARTFETRGEADVLVRVADTLNGLFFLAPLWPVGLAAWWFGRTARAPRPRGANEPPPGHVLVLPVLLAIAGQLALMLVIRATRGGGRDWDASTAPALTVALAAAGALAVAWPRAGRAGAIAPVVTLALACAATNWGLHASPRMNLARIQTQLDARPAWSATSLSFAHNQIGVFLLNHADPAAAARHFETAFSLAPNPRYAYQAGLAHYDAGDRDAARREFQQAVARNPRSPGALYGLARIALDEGDMLTAMALADSTLRLNPDHAQAGWLRREVMRRRESRP